MKKSITSFICQECGYDSPKFLGKCPECGVWNSLREIHMPKALSTPVSLRSQASSFANAQSAPKRLEEITLEEKHRIKTCFTELDTVLGGGIVKGSVILLAGDPGIGKSTLLLQIALNFSNSNKVVLNEVKDPLKKIQIADKEILRSAQNDKQPVLYITGEESQEQIKLRAERISKNTKNSNLLILSSSNTDAVALSIAKEKPWLAVIDSIQTMESENVAGLSGSVGQVRYAASQFIKVAKALNIPVILVGHVTKEGMVAGPMVLSHMVDTVLFLEGEKFTKTRILRSLKNRFGSIDEVGIFTMGESGIEEIKNLEHIFLTKNANKNTFGCVLVVTVEGSRAFLVEIQGLVVASRMPLIRRVASGLDYKRLELLLAVLQKHCNLPIGAMDVFVNVAGGLKISDPAADLGICLAIFSSFRNISFSDTVAISEVGLLGELRRVPSFEKRIKEAKKLGFKKIISYENYKMLNEVIKQYINEK